MPKFASTKPLVLRSPSGRYADWEATISKARQRPNVWFLAFPAAPTSTLITVRKRRAPALRSLTDGRLEAEARSGWTDESGTRRADIYIRFTPKE